MKGDFQFDFSCSRAKAKSKKLATDNQVRQLMREKQDLELKVQVLEKELNLIRSWVGQGRSREECNTAGGVKAWQPDPDVESKKE